jgi:hypothetical protein
MQTIIVTNETLEQYLARITQTKTTEQEQKDKELMWMNSRN